VREALLVNGCCLHGPEWKLTAEYDDGPGGLKWIVHHEPFPDRAKRKGCEREQRRQQENGN
jgi:hypothetical protein